MKTLTFFLLLSLLKVSIAQDGGYQDMDNTEQTQDNRQPEEQYSGQDELEQEKDQQSRYQENEEPEQPMEQEPSDY